MMKYPGESSQPPGLFAQGNPTPHLAALTEAGVIAAVHDLIGIAMEADARGPSNFLSAISAHVKTLLPDRLPELKSRFAVIDT